MLTADVKANRKCGCDTKKRPLPSGQGKDYTEAQLELLLALVEGDMTHVCSDGKKGKHKDNGKGKNEQKTEDRRKEIVAIKKEIQDYKRAK